MSVFVTRDETLPPAYSQALEWHALPPLWTALHVLLPKERVTAAVPHRWSWRGARPPLLQAAPPGARAEGQAPRGLAQDPRFEGPGPRPPAPLARPRRTLSRRRATRH